MEILWISFGFDTEKNQVCQIDIHVSGNRDGMIEKKSADVSQFLKNNMLCIIIAWFFFSKVDQ